MNNNLRRGRDLNDNHNSEDDTDLDSDSESKSNNNETEDVRIDINNSNNNIDIESDLDSDELNIELNNILNEIHNSESEIISAKNEEIIVMNSIKFTSNCCINILLLFTIIHQTIVLINNKDLYFRYKSLLLILHFMNLCDIFIFIYTIILYIIFICRCFKCLKLKHIFTKTKHIYHFYIFITFITHIIYNIIFWSIDYDDLRFHHNGFFIMCFFRLLILNCCFGSTCLISCFS